MNQLSSLSNDWHIAMMILPRFTGWKCWNGWNLRVSFPRTHRDEAKRAAKSPNSPSHEAVSGDGFQGSMIRAPSHSKWIEWSLFLGETWIKMAREKHLELESHVSGYLGCWEQRWSSAYIKWDTLFYTVVDIYTVVYICTSTDMYISISLYALKVYQQDSVGYCLGFVCFLIMSYFRATLKT